MDPELALRLAKESKDNSAFMLKNSLTHNKTAKVYEKAHNDLDRETEESHENMMQLQEIQDILFPKKTNSKSECIVYTKPVKRGTGPNRPLITSLTPEEKRMLDQLLALP